MKKEYLLERRIKRIKIIILVIILGIVLLCSLTMGRYAVPFSDMLDVFLAKSTNEMAGQVLFEVRIPRILAAAIIGASLSISGAAYQGMFKNPLVSPDLLGASAGAGFGAALGILFSFGLIGIKVMSFGFGLVAVFLAWFISSRFGRGDDGSFILILGGILVSTVFQSLISCTKYVADPDDKLPAITFWLMGSLAKVNYEDVLMLFIPFILGTIPLIMLSFKLNIMSFGEEEAKTLGINVNFVRGVVVVAATVLTASSVSLCGMIGWVGLVIPHLTRMVVGPDFKYLIPTSALVGSIYLLVIDNISRTISAIEIPLGILTSLIGAPFFVYLLMKRKKGWV
ncbi:MAG: iron ABC transporter permease [Clostridium sp.]